MGREPDASIAPDDAESQLRVVEDEIELLENQRADTLLSRSPETESPRASSSAATCRYVGILEARAALLRRIAGA